MVLNILPVSGIKADPYLNHEQRWFRQAHLGNIRVTNPTSDVWMTGFRNSRIRAIKMSETGVWGCVTLPPLQTKIGHAMSVAFFYLKPSGS